MPVSKQRLKMKDLVTEVFIFLSKRYEQTDDESITQMVVPVEDIRSYLNEKYEISYTSNQHIFNQLRSYEEELGVPLFRKVRVEGNRDNFSIGLNINFESFKQKQLLYLNQKIKIANAVYERILNDQGDFPEKKTLKILLGAGTEVYYVSEALASGVRNHGLSLDIYTHNMGVIDFFMNEGSVKGNIRLYSRHSRIDMENNIFLSSGDDLYKSVQFDYIIQAATYIFDGKLFVDSPEESLQKKDILDHAAGEKLLISTKHEFTDEFTAKLEPYGSLNQYNYLIVPNSKTQSEKKKQYNLLFDQYMGKILEPEITHYNYRVFRILK